MCPLTEKLCLFGYDAARKESMKLINKDTNSVVHRGHKSFLTVR